MGDGVSANASSAVAGLALAAAAGVEPVRQWVLSVPFPLLSVPFPLRFLFANRPEVMGEVLGIVYRPDQEGRLSP